MTKITYFPSVIIEDGHLRQDERDRLGIFRHHRHGDQAIAQAVLDLLEGITKIEGFAFAEHPNPDVGSPDPGKIHGYVYVILEKAQINPQECYLTPFWCNEYGETCDAVIGPSSHSVNPAMFTASLAIGLERGRKREESLMQPTGTGRLTVFRITELPEGYDPDWWISKEK